MTTHRRRSVACMHAGPRQWFDRDQLPKVPVLCQALLIECSDCGLEGRAARRHRRFEQLGVVVLPLLNVDNVPGAPRATVTTSSSFAPAGFQPNAVPTSARRRSQGRSGRKHRHIQSDHRYGRGFVW